MEYAHVKKDILGRLPCVERNALSVQTAPNIKHVSTRNAGTRVQEHVALMLGVKL